MNLSSYIMSFDMEKLKQENCNCVDCIFTVQKAELKSQNNDYPELSEKEIEQIISEGYSDKDEKTKIFIRKALKVHGYKYDYSKVIYIKAIEKVEIICKVEGHKSFLQTPDKHLQKRGCRKCQYEELANKRKMTLDKFVEKARKIHNNKYDYSKTKYINTNTEVIISCPIHGDFLQTPHHHLKGCGCSICSGTKRLTTKEFIEKANLIHKNKYDYSKVEYKNYETKVTIICPKHGEFLQTPDGHLIGQGCQICGIEKRINKRKMTKEEFIEKAKEVHNDKYNYSLVKYDSCNKKVKIICPVHGGFLQMPSIHLQGHGCLKCGHEYVGKCNKMTRKEFIEKARKIHNDIYIYSLVEYKGINKEVSIICLKHGKFLQKPIHHLQGSGCQKCNKNKGEYLIENFLIKKRIEFKEQKTFNNCKYKKLLKFDFYVPQYNLCIEYDGEQHFKKVNWTGKMTEEQMEKNLKLNQFRDQIKNNYCENNNIALLRIRYDEDVEEKLIKYFYNNKIIKEQTIFDLVS